MAITESFATAQEAVQLVQELTPTLKTMSRQYIKAAPLIDFTIDYWPVAVAVGFLGIVTGSAIGAVLPQYSKRRK